MSKLSFRARALDPSKPMPIYFAEELPDLPEYSAINRAVPQMPSGMEKEEESEHHLQRAIIAGLIIPTPEVSDVKDDEFYDKNYPADYKMPRQLIHMQPFSMEQDIPDYDMDSSDELWLTSQAKRLELSPLKFEQMMDKLEKNSGQTVTTLNEAKALLNQDDDISIAVYDYWLNKRLTTQHPLLLSVKTESRGNTGSNNPYLAFRRRTEKMQTRKNRKNDETSYEKMLKLRRDLSRAVNLLEMIKRREKTKREQLHLSIEIYEKRYQAKDFSGQLLTEYTAAATKSRSAFAPIYSNQYVNNRSMFMAPSHHSQNQWNTTSMNQQNYSNSSQYHYGVYSNHLPSNNNYISKRELDGISNRKEKRQYKKRKHKTQREKIVHRMDTVSSDEEDTNNVPTFDGEDEGHYTFKRIKNCNYFKPCENDFGNWPWENKSANSNSFRDRSKYRFTLTSVRRPSLKCIGFARRRYGRGGRIVVDRIRTDMDDVWSKLDFKVLSNDSHIEKQLNKNGNLLNNDLNDNDYVDSVVVGGNSTVTAAQVTTTATTITTSSLSPVKIVTNKIQTTTTTNNCENVNDHRTSNISLNIKQEKLDDFELLLDSANASFNINKSIGSTMIGNSTELATSLSTDLANNSAKKRSLTNNNSSSLDTMNISNVSIKVEPMDTSSMELEANSNTNKYNNNINSANTTAVISEDNKLLLADQVSSISNNTNNNFNNNMDDDDEDDDDSLDNVYQNLLDEIKNDWLHFRPITPTELPPEKLLQDDSDNNMMIFDTDLPIGSSSKFAIEMQSLNSNTEKSTTTSSNSDRKLFTSRPFDVKSLVDDPQTIVVENRKIKLNEPDVRCINPSKMHDLMDVELITKDDTLFTNILSEQRRRLVNDLNNDYGNSLFKLDHSYEVRSQTSKVTLPNAVEPMKMTVMATPIMTNFQNFNDVIKREPISSCEPTIINPTATANAAAAEMTIATSVYIKEEPNLEVQSQKDAFSKCIDLNHTQINLNSSDTRQFKIFNGSNDNTFKYLNPRN